MAPRTSRAAVAARTQIIDELKNDHKRVKKAYRDFQKIDAESDPERCAVIVEQVLQELTVHAALEEELLYPAAHGQIEEESLVDEAEVEHESMHALIDQLRNMQPGDEKYAARFTVLCEYVLHHVKEEENDMFPQLENAKLDWETLAEEMTSRRQALTAAEGSAEGTGDGAEEGADDSESASAEADDEGSTEESAVSTGGSARKTTRSKATRA